MANFWPDNMWSSAYWPDGEWPTDVVITTPVDGSIGIYETDTNLVENISESTLLIDFLNENINLSTDHDFIFNHILNNTDSHLVSSYDLGQNFRMNFLEIGTLQSLTEQNLDLQDLFDVDLILLNNRMLETNLISLADVTEIDHVGSDDYRYFLGLTS